MADLHTRSRNAEWRRQTAALKVSAKAWRESEAERRKTLRPLAKAAAGLGIDLKAMTAMGRARFEDRCAQADQDLKKRDAARRSKGKS